MKKLLARFARQSPALVVAMIALFVALTGTAVATTSALITGNQIKNNSITGLDVKNRSLRPIDFRGSVRGPRGLRGLPGAAGATGATGATGAKGDKGDKGDPGNPATADGATIQIGRVAHPGGTPACLTGSASGYTVSGACTITALREQSGLVPVSRVVRNLTATISTAHATVLRVYLIRGSTGAPLMSCDIPIGQTTCSNTTPLAIDAGTLLAVEVDHIGGSAPSSVGFGFEILSPAGAAVTAAPAPAPAMRTAASS